MRNEILRQLQSEYEQRRMANMAEEARRRAEAVARCPELAAWLEERENMLIRSLRGILDGTSAYDDLPSRMELANSRIKSLLIDNGYPEDWLEPVYRCQKCRDTGYTGEPIREMCSCMRSAFYARLYREVGLSEMDEQSFDTFDLSVFPDTFVDSLGCTQRDSMLVIRSLCEEYADRYPSASTKDLLLMGQSGLGKTFLMHAIARRLLDRGFNVLMISAYRFLELARKAYFSASTELLSSLIETDVLLIDDLGSEPLMENITIVQLFNLINERQTAGRGTVLSTNLTAEELRERYTERITSRLLDPRQCGQLTFGGDDVRHRKGVRA